MMLAALLTAFKIKGETPEEIAGAAAAMRDNAVPFERPNYLYADSCGTGGDGSNTINISTTAAIVAAAAGLPIVKHGNRSVSSRSGSADLMEALGLDINLSPERSAACLDECNMTFLFAPAWHAGVKHAMPTRKALKTRTLFNLLGPLLNPARPAIQLMGVYDADLCLPIAKTLKILGVERALVVNGSGTDEIALHGPTTVAELNFGEITEYKLTPADFGAPDFTLEDVKGGSPEENAESVLAILRGEAPDAHNYAIAVNVGALLYLFSKVDNVKEGAEQALALIKSGNCMNTLEKLRQFCAAEQEQA